MIRKRLHSGDKVPSYRLYARSSTAMSFQKPDHQGGLVAKSRSLNETRPSLTVGLLTRLRFPSPSGRCLRANRAYKSDGESVSAIRLPADKDPESQCRPAK